MVNPTQATQGTIRPTDLHRVFLQSVLSRRVMPEEIMVQLYLRAISACQVADENFRPTHGTNKAGARSFALEINRILEQSGMQMEMKSIRDEGSVPRDMWAMINTDPTDEAANMTDLEPLQLSFFKAIANNIITSYPANSINHFQALSLTSGLPGQLTKSAGDTLLSTFVARGWLAKSVKRGRYSLAPRAIMELDNWLLAEHEEYIQKCGRCSKTVLSGVICANSECESHIHKTCYTLLMTGRTPACPVCKKDFATYDPKPLGEKAVNRVEDTTTQIRTKRKRNTESGANGRAGPSRGGDDDEEDELEEEEGQTDNEEPEEGSAGAAGGSSVQVGNGTSQWKAAKTGGRPKRAAAAKKVQSTQSEEESD
ncbi:uncharacterized protein MKK02DRAFT_41099 [Dioszegia hungarica]|uniref:Non-structural maintenance of chromosomes element 1 homolog n=1 Tax=Dioszegia hungarica TaxID=4972 RepID=A0AA38LQ23_9TREE|nr:uncharacterized protein MKK02DRAFT_41099 [Dioszegia hungarica]KAI9632787.1 hypothetical protein MKK02DRAFT_41099 [Dioszegia hungarica]